MFNKLILMFTLSPAILFAQTKPPESVGLDWLSLIDARSYEESWNTSGELFRSRITKDEWIVAVSTARDVVGDIQSRDLFVTKAMTALPNFPDGDYVVFRYQSIFSEQQATETLTLVKCNKGWRVIGYFIH